jgi:hypothetical protein
MEGIISVNKEENSTGTRFLSPGDMLECKHMVEDSNNLGFGCFRRCRISPVGVVERARNSAKGGKGRVTTIGGVVSGENRGVRSSIESVDGDDSLCVSLLDEAGTNSSTGGSSLGMQLDIMGVGASFVL